MCLLLLSAKGVFKARNLLANLEGGERGERGVGAYEYRGACAIRVSACRDQKSISGVSFACSPCLFLRQSLSPNLELDWLTHNP